MVKQITTKLVEDALISFAETPEKPSKKQKLNEKIFAAVSNQELRDGAKSFVKTLKNGLAEEYYGKNFEEESYEGFLKTIEDESMAPEDLMKYGKDALVEMQVLTTMFMCTMQAALVEKA